MSVKFTVALIARNEARNMDRLHKSLSGFQQRGGEVVLVDTGSTDNTVQVAKGMGFKVFEMGEAFIVAVPDNLVNKINQKFIVKGEEKIIQKGDRIFNYAAARNYAASVASNDIVSMPDCDEQYTNLNIDAIEATIAEGYEQMEFHFIFAHYPNGQPSVQFRQCKMYDRRKLHWNGMVHEVLVGEAKRTYFPPDVLLLEHFQAPQEHRSRYMPGLALDCYNNPDNDRNSHYLGRELFWNGRPKSAIKELTRHVAMDRWAQERGESLIFIGDAHRVLGNDEIAVDSYQKAFVVDGTRRAPLLRLAQFYETKKDWQKVVCFAKAALEIAPNDCYCNVGAHYTYEPYERLYVAYWWMGDKKQSRECWEKAYAFDPTNPKFVSDIQFYEQLKYQDQGIEGWMSLRELNWLYEQASMAKSVLEVGSWKGRSTHALLSGCKGTVTSVDTFQGSMDPGDDTNRQAKLIDVYAEFQKNVGDFKNLEVLRMTSEEAADKCRSECRRFDMVFIDAGHTYEEVKKDIQLWEGMARVVIAGHDYIPSIWPGVCSAVDQSYPDKSVCDSIWYKAVPSEEVPMPSIVGKYPESLSDFTRNIQSNTPFTFVKCGDGELACMYGDVGSNCDGQSYSPELASDLRNAYRVLTSRGAYMAVWEDIAEADGKLLLHRTDTKSFVDLKLFYKSIRDSNKTKVFIGPHKLFSVSNMLLSGFIPVQGYEAYSQIEDTWERMKKVLVDGGIYIFSAGLAAKVLIARALEHTPNITCIDAGSSFDPIFVGQTRTYQIDQDTARGLYAGWLVPRVPKRIFTIWLNEDPKVPEIVQKCIDSQKIPGYDHEIITLDNYPKGIPYIEQAIAAKKWAKAADYIRIQQLIEKGGIYCDADVQILPGKNFDDMLEYSIFASYEKSNRYIASCVMGAEPNNPALARGLKEIASKFRGDDDKVFEASMGLLSEIIYYYTDYGSAKVLEPEYFVPYDHQSGEINVTPNTRTFHNFTKTWAEDKKDVLPKVAILIPTLGRPEGLKRCLDSIDKLYYPKHLIEVVVDDGREEVPIKVNRMYDNTSADVYVYAANDMEFNPSCIYEAVRLSKYYGLVSFNAGSLLPDKGNICEHFLITKKLAESFGEIFSERFHHVGCDNLLWAKADMNKQAVWCANAKVTHHHFSKGNPMDQVYHLGWSHVEEDRATLQQELNLLRGAA